MPFVLDASITACWAFDDEDHPVAACALERMRHDEAVAPAIWWFEVRNIWIVGELRRRLGAADTTAFLRELSRFGVIIDRSPEETLILTHARQHLLPSMRQAIWSWRKEKHCPLPPWTRPFRGLPPRSISS